MIGERFREVAQRHRDRVAVVDDAQRLTYGHLLERVDGCAAGSTPRSTPCPAR